MPCILCQIKKGIILYNGIAKEYKHWFVMVSREQHTLGTSLIVLKRHTVRFSSLKKEELLELNRIQKKTEKKLDKIFKPDLYNYLQCGNQVEHLHFHLIPRYKQPRSFGGKKFVDKNFGDSVKETKQISSKEFIEKLKKVL